MADIAASDVTYAKVEGSSKGSPSDPRTSNIMSITFGNGALTYPSGGVPLTKAKLGCPAVIEDFVFIDSANANGYVAKYNPVTEKIRLYQIGALDGNAASAQALTELAAGSTAPAAMTLKARVVGY